LSKQAEPVDWFLVQRAASVLRAGGVVAHATEGVWGLACIPESASAVARILALKNRDPDKGLIVIGDDEDRFEGELAGLGEGARDEVLDSWPGPVTWLVPNCRFPRWVTGRHETVAVRVPGHAQSRRLCAAVGGPLISTSANPSRRAPARSALAVRQLFRSGIDYLLPGETCGRVVPSVIRDAVSRAVIRRA
jgi:L-threonylcarbamoyladenylate synthase